MNKNKSLRLTEMVSGAGWASKLSPGDLDKALHGLDFPTDKNVLVGLNTADDAGVYQISEDLALIQTVDFFTPIVNDPFDFGRIAAANALSDVYAYCCRFRAQAPLTSLPYIITKKPLLSYITQLLISYILIVVHMLDLNCLS